MRAADVLMRRLLFAATFLLLAARCATSSYDSMGYAVVDDEGYGCDFYYGSSYYYPGGGNLAPRMAILPVERVRIPRVVDRGGDAGDLGGARIGSERNDAPAAAAADRMPVAPPATHAPPRAVGPRN